MTHTTQVHPDITTWALLTGLATYTLADDWYVQPLDAFRQGFYFADEGNWLPIDVPGHWQQHPDLTEHVGCVVYRCHFTFPPELPNNGVHTTRYWLRVNGAFYWSEPYLNGTSLGRHEGYFAPYEQEITTVLQDENTLLLEVECPDEHDKFGKRMITGVFSHWDCLDPLTNPGGIWLPIEIHTSGPVRLQAAHCYTDSYTDDVAQLHYTAELDAALSGPVVLRWSIEPRNFTAPTQIIEQRRTLRAGKQEISGLFKILEPHLWWTHDLGPANLYTITLEVLAEGVVSDRYSFVFGIRQFEMRNWIPYLNGMRFLIKGNNYAPGDMWISSMTSKRCAYDMRLARECNMNLLRVHAHVDHPALYHAANEAGILLWQDMPLQWIYQVSVLPEAERQVHAMVRLLYNHPSIVIWCMHNEPVFVADTADETTHTLLRTYASMIGFSWNRDVMDTRLKQLTEKEDPSRFVVRASGEAFIPFFRQGTDAHVYFGWYRAYGTLHDAKRLIGPLETGLRFVTEFGAQSFPNIESCLKFMPADIHDIDFPFLEERHSFQGHIMGKWIDWHEAESLAELVDMTQDYQIFINRFYIDRLRYRKYRPTGGIVAFVFLDSYPAVSWSVVDYWRIPKRSYTALRMAYNPQYAFAIFDPRIYRMAEPVELPVYVVNDAQYLVPEAHLTVRLTNPEGVEIAAVEHVLTLEADCLAREVDRLRLTPTMQGQYKLSLGLVGVEPETHQVYHVEVA